MDEQAPATAYPRTFTTFVDLRDGLDELNYELGIDATGITTGSGTAFWFAYCTDPDGLWCVESGHPGERLADDGCYDTLPLDTVRGMGPWTILWAPAS
ncbi:hypothetical protein [Arthrobacter sp. zg-Y1110]|uniref:hypothetical protein n=1 Tax=Arthrobacter sp. zg-Y1110 TaxID=2886932 RepID=UPI001D157421|nr:hypothetical protein [Arthrobacter sp. zg-Y1110]MCC3292949.1 hypothetical protein [Arthrobacter sp. zg-Y1110]UWX86888.1 hypothetical protein N2K99_18770 [Arthrobacter sp. zg-Y1110]